MINIIKPVSLSDLSKPLVDDKAHLPAIIVTPSSPTHDRDFQIAFLAPEPKENVASRVFARLQKGSHSPQFKPRTILLLFIPMFILFCHVLTHRFASRHPHLHFDKHTQGGVVDIHADGSGNGYLSSWFDMNDYWDGRHARDFVIEEEEDPATPLSEPELR